MKSTIFSILALALTGCHNYTTAPLCTEANTVDPMDIPGFAGVYQYTIQDAEFRNTTEVVDLSGSAKTMSVLNDGATCLIDGDYYVQSQDEYGFGYWSYERMVVSGTGISLFEMIFDRPSLEASGVATSTFEIPDTVKKILGEDVSNFVTDVAQNVLAGKGDALGLAIDNVGVAPEDVLVHAEPLPVGFTLLRQ